MSYYIDEDKVTLDNLQNRIEETDLVPSRILLLEKIDKQFVKLKEHGFFTLKDLRKGLENKKDIPTLSKKTGIDHDYLVLLRREIEGYFPKACQLNSFDWLPQKDIAKLETLDYKNSVLLFEALSLSEKKTEIINDYGFEPEFIESIHNLLDLTRIQWVSPNFARMLVSAGYTNVRMVSMADADELCSKLDKVNKENKYFKGKIGLRDIKRLVKAASYVS
ncbi:DUF4332 domain-containing protein [Alkalibacterium sp. 20]|uniref:DUF4332 domain-containing protein n=1 Tax=Alkalibacterium sp. 20 TaxID=1798803 RepID=UPI00090046DE|nr:DUF4332 domain-containing protein [Alkalibacterium sp. 20]OJF92407.1 hypothetical protein AX762_10170 [Alkalibacterium sp. 20]